MSGVPFQLKCGVGEACICMNIHDLWPASGFSIMYNAVMFHVCKTIAFTTVIHYII